MNRLAGACRILKTTESETNTRHFRNLHFRLAITMAHELVHVYNLFLQRSQHNHTPPHVTYGGYGDDKVGESGRYWEYILLGGFADMRQTPEGMEAITLRDSHGQKCWRIKAAVIDGILGRHFNKWLQPGTPLNDPEHPKNQVTELITTIDWKTKFKDVFPPVPATQAAQGPQQMLPAQIARLTGPEMLKTPRYNMCGQDLQTFALQPRVVLRQASAV